MSGSTNPHGNSPYFWGDAERLAGRGRKKRPGRQAWCFTSLCRWHSNWNIGNNSTVSCCR